MINPPKDCGKFFSIENVFSSVREMFRDDLTDEEYYELEKELEKSDCYLRDAEDEVDRLQEQVDDLNEEISDLEDYSEILQNRCERYEEIVNGSNWNLWYL